MMGSSMFLRSALRIEVVKYGIIAPLPILKKKSIIIHSHIRLNLVEIHITVYYRPTALWHIIKMTSGY